MSGPGQKIGIEHGGRVYFGVIVKRTYNPKTYRVYVRDLEQTIEVST